MTLLPSVVCLACGIVLTVPLRAAGADWKPLDKTELALAASAVERDADAEALFWEVKVADEFNSVRDEPQTVFEHYIRIKIFTDRGREAHATVDIPYTSSTQVSNLAARTIRPDGSVVELKGSDVYRRTLFKREGLKVDVISFALPGVERGAIVEYRWRERHRESLASHLRLPFWREIPVQQVRYYLRPLNLAGWAVPMHAVPFNADITPPQRQRDGYSLVTLSNVPAYRDEPYAPPDWTRRPWLFIFYSSDQPLLGDRFWTGFSKELFADYAGRTKPNDDIRRLAAAAVAGAAGDEQRASALLRVLRERFKRVDVDTADPEERRRARGNRNAADALKRGLGTEEDAAILYVALANASGLEARIAAAPDRGDMFVTQAHGHAHFFRGRLVALRSGTGWKFLDPANEHSATGSLRWQYEMQKVFVADPKESVLVDAPRAADALSPIRRTAQLRLAEDGMLEGECRIEYSGHWGQTLKEQYDDLAQADREKNYREQLLKRWTGAEISELRIENVTEPDKPYTASFRVRFAGYAQRTGSRLVLQPALFQRGVEPVFTAEIRNSDLYFPFPLAEHDHLEIELPSGYELEQPEAPAPLTSSAARYSTSLKVVVGEPKKLLVTREFSFGLDDSVLFRAEHYRGIKQLFDLVHSRDGHSLILRRLATE